MAWPCATKHGAHLSVQREAKAWTALDETDAVIEITLLRTFQLAHDKAPIAVPAGTQRLLAFLALAGVAVKRTLVAGTLWPESSERHAFGNLRSALARLGAAGRPAVKAGPGELELAPGAIVDACGARALALRLVAPAPPASADLDQAAVLALSGELLPGWYDDWVLVAAEEWRQLRLHALEALAVHLTNAGRFGEAAVAASTSVRAEPLRESAHACLIRVHLAEGNVCEAYEQLARLRLLLRTELGLEPSRRVTELFPERDRSP